MPESEPMAFVQGMILQIRKHIPESGYLPTYSDRKPLKNCLWKSTDLESESDFQMTLKVVALLIIQQTTGCLMPYLRILTLKEN